MMIISKYFVSACFQSDLHILLERIANKCWPLLKLQLFFVVFPVCCFYFAISLAIDFEKCGWQQWIPNFSCSISYGSINEQSNEQAFVRRRWPISFYYFVRCCCGCCFSCHSWQSFWNYNTIVFEEFLRFFFVIFLVLQLVWNEK